MTKPSKEQSKRSAADIYVAFEYQWNYFVYTLLNEIDETSIVSFELHDDADKQTDEAITFYQIKHSIQKTLKGRQLICLIATLIYGRLYLIG